MSSSSGTPQQLLLDPSVLEVRPHVIGAVLRGVTFTKARYNSFIDLQVSLKIPQNPQTLIVDQTVFRTNFT